MWHFSTYTIPPFISSLLFFALGFLVYFKNKKSKINNTFAIVCFVTFWWQFSWFLLFGVQSEDLANYLVRIGYMGIILIPITFFHFFVLFLERFKKFDKWLVYFSYLMASIFGLALITTNYFVSGFYKYPWGFYPKASFLHLIYLLLLIILALRIFLLLISFLKNRVFVSRKRSQIKFLLWATLFYLFASVDFLVNYGVNLYPLGFIFILIFLGMVAYAIVQHRLMDIRIVVRQVTVYGVSLIISLGLSFALMLIALNYLSFYISSPFIGSIILIFGIVVFQFIKNRFGRFANKHLFYTLYSYEKTLADLTEKLSKSIDLNRLVFLSTETIKDVMKLDKIALILRKLEPPKGQLKLLENHYDKKDILKDKEEEDDFYLAKNLAFNEEKINSLIKNLFLIHYLESGKSLVVKDELEHLAEEADDERLKNKFLTLVDFMEKAETTLYLPLLIEDRLIGLFVLGKKVSGDAYTVQDIGLLETVASQVSIAINNAQLYEQSQYFNQILRVRVVEATKELAGAYRELKKLDDSKTEFLSLASHQLRTPLSAIKGYLSMVLEGSFGKLQKETEEALRNVYESNERLIVLVNDLLNITRIEAGKLEYKAIKTDFDELIKSVVNELKLTAEKKNLALKYTDKNLPYVLIDPGKIRQVLINLIDNAIKYTPHGEVVIKTSVRNKKEIVIEVRDTGIGISKDKMEHLFEWLSRGKGALRLDARGFGLGLYIAKKIVERAGGKIWAESPGEKKGSTFAFSIPIR